MATPETDTPRAEAFASARPHHAAEYEVRRAAAQLLCVAADGGVWRRVVACGGVWHRVPACNGIERHVAARGGVLRRVAAFYGFVAACSSV